MAVSELKKGMFVSELDRPWTETSFLLQGVLIEGAEEINQFQQSCDFVFIDDEKSTVEVHPHLQPANSTAGNFKTSNLNAIEQATQEADIEQTD